MFGNGWKLGFYLMSEGNLTKSLPVWSEKKAAAASASLAPWMNTDAPIPSALPHRGPGARNWVSHTPRKGSEALAALEDMHDYLRSSVMSVFTSQIVSLGTWPQKTR